MVRQFNDGLQARVQNDGELSEPFKVMNEVKQDCYCTDSVQHDVSVMLMEAVQNSDTGIPIRYRFDGNIFNLRRLQATTKVQTHVLNKLIYTDDMGKNASSEATRGPMVL